MLMMRPCWVKIKQMIKLELRVDDTRWHDLPELGALITQALEAGAKISGVRGEISLLLTDNDALQALNREFRSRDKPTDVLSFPASEIETPFLGDIAIAYGVAAKDAKAQSKTLADHLAHLLIHGLLHLAGFDHETDTEAQEMEAMEIKALAIIGLSDPYLVPD